MIVTAAIVKKPIPRPARLITRNSVDSDDWTWARSVVGLGGTSAVTWPGWYGSSSAGPWWPISCAAPGAVRAITRRGSRSPAITPATYGGTITPSSAWDSCWEPDTIPTTVTTVPEMLIAGSPSDEL